MIDQIDEAKLDEAKLNEALELLHLATRTLVATPDAILARRGLSRVHHRVLYYVGRHPDCSVNRLLEKLAVSKQALHGPLRQLLKQKLIVARAADTDRRSKCLRLTPAGKRLEVQLSGGQRERLAQIFDKAGTRDAAAWRRIMRALAARE